MGEWISCLYTSSKPMIVWTWVMYIILIELSILVKLTGLQFLEWNLQWSLYWFDEFPIHIWSE
jgi:hypothetical protein